MIYLKKFKRTPVSWFILFLGYNFFNEMVAGAYYISGLGNNNTIFYNVHQVIYISSYFSLFYYSISWKSFRMALFLFYITWLVSFVYLLCTTDLILEYALLSSLLGDFLIMISVLFVLVEIIYSARVSEEKDNILIYLGLGLLIYLVVNIPTSVTTFLGWAKIGGDTGPRMEFYKILRDVGTFTGALMYFIFAYGFYKAKPQEVKS